MNRKLLAVSFLAAFMMIGCSDDNSDDKKPSGNGCNNGVLNEGEICDGQQFAAGVRVCPPGTKLKDGLTENNIRCTPTCTLNTDDVCVPEAAPGLCGNAKLDDGEVCDGALFKDGVRVCPQGMTLKKDKTLENIVCTSSCMLDTADACAVPSGPTCGDQVVNGDEVCDGTSFKDGAAVCPEGMTFAEGKSAADILCTDSCQINIPDGVCAPVGESCSGTVLQLCDEKECVSEDCADTGRICVEGEKDGAKTAECVPASCSESEAGQRKCAEGTNYLLSCVNEGGKYIWKADSCGKDRVCTGDAPDALCKGDLALKCNGDILTLGEDTQDCAAMGMVCKEYVDNNEMTADCVMAECTEAQARSSECVNNYLRVCEKKGDAYLWNSISCGKMQCTPDASGDAHKARCKGDLTLSCDGDVLVLSDGASEERENCKEKYGGTCEIYTDNGEDTARCTEGSCTAAQENQTECIGDILRICMSDGNGKYLWMTDNCTERSLACGKSANGTYDCVSCGNGIVETWNGEQCDVMGGEAVFPQFPVINCHYYDGKNGLKFYKEGSRPTCTNECKVNISGGSCIEVSDSDYTENKKWTFGSMQQITDATKSGSVVMHGVFGNQQDSHSKYNNGWEVSNWGKNSTTFSDFNKSLEFVVGNVNYNGIRIQLDVRRTQKNSPTVLHVGLQKDGEKVAKIDTIDLGTGKNGVEMSTRTILYMNDAPTAEKVSVYITAGGGSDAAIVLNNVRISSVKTI